MKILQQNNELAFIVAMRRNHGDNVPKLCKSDEKLYLNESDAFKMCEQRNLEADPTGKLKVFGVYEGKPTRV